MSHSEIKGETNDLVILALLQTASAAEDDGGGSGNGTKSHTGTQS